MKTIFTKFALTGFMICANTACEKTPSTQQYFKRDAHKHFAQMLYRLDTLTASQSLTEKSDEASAGSNAAETAIYLAELEKINPAYLRRKRVTLDARNQNVTFYDSINNVSLGMHYPSLLRP